jgi:hypothetical protein
VHYCTTLSAYSSGCPALKDANTRKDPEIQRPCPPLTLRSTATRSKNWSIYGHAMAQGHLVTLS